MIIGMAISTIVTALTHKAVPFPSLTPPDGKGGKEWVKKQLQALGHVLAKLAAKVAEVLPSIFETVVLWLLNLLSKGAMWLTGNLWALIVGIACILFVIVKGELSSDKPKCS